MTRTVNPKPEPASKPEEYAEELPSPTAAMVEWNTTVLAENLGAREAFIALLESIPEAPPDAAARIVMAVLGSESIEDIDKPWDAEGMRDFENTMLRVHDLHKMPSAYAGGLGVYLVCQCSQPEVGDMFVLTTGSVSIVAQLVRAYTLQALPLDVIPRKSERATKRGYWPMHLELVRRAGRRVRTRVIEGEAAEVPVAAAEQVQ